MSTFLDAALSLAARGLPVFPLTPGAKTPAIKDWQKLATTDADKIRGVWTQRDYNIGVLMGGGVIGIDIDVKGDKPGEASFAALGLDLNALDTLIVRTASGGWHVYLAGEDVSNSAGALGAGLDVRGAGGYLVGPGSVLSNGSGRGSYAIVHDALSLLPAPAELLRRLGKRPERRDDLVQVPAVDLDDETAVTLARDYLLAAPAAIENAGGDDLTYRTIARVKDYGVSETVALELLYAWNDRCSPPWGDEALQEKVGNVYRYGQNAPGSLHPAAVFGDIHIDPPPAPVVVPSAWFRHGDVEAHDPTWLFKHLLPWPGTAVIVGPPNAGKTFLEVELSRCGATGKPFFNVKPKHLFGTAFLFAGTEGSAIGRRFAALQEDRALPISATTVNNLAGRGALDALVATLREEAARMEMLFGVPLRMVVLETLSASGLLMHEDDNAEAGRAMANLGTIARMLGILFVTTTHPPKEGRGIRGAGSITGAADYVIEIYREGRDTLRRVELVKARDAEQRMLGSFTLVPVKLGVDADGDAITSMAVSMGEPIKAEERTPARLKEFMRALDFAQAESTETIEGEQMIPLVEFRAVFKDQTVDMDSGNRSRAWKKLLDYAASMGAIELRAVHGTEYVIRKEIEGE